MVRDLLTAGLHAAGQSVWWHGPDEPSGEDSAFGRGGSHWIQPIDIDLGELRGGRSWIRITPDGVTREIRFPHRFDPYRFVSGRIWGVQRDEFDVASVAWIQVPATR